MAELTLELMQSELSNLRAQKDSAINTVHAVEGAIQFAEHLIEKLKQETEVKSDGNNSTSAGVCERTESISRHRKHK